VLLYPGAGAGVTIRCHVHLSLIISRDLLPPGADLA